MVSKEQHARVIERLEEVIEIAEDHFDQKFRFPTIVYKVRGATAGKAHYHEWKVDFNSAIYTRVGEDFIQRTVAHEMAHLITCQVYPETLEPKLKCYRLGRPIYKREAHGPRWKSVMVMLGCDPDRCHTYDVEGIARRRERFTWICSVHGTEMNLGPKQHPKQMSGRQSYMPRGTACTRRTCHGKFQYGDAIQREIRRFAANAPAASKTPTRRSSGRSMKEQTAILYRTVNGARKLFIQRCEQDLGMKKSTASTYHHNFKSGKWSV